MDESAQSPKSSRKRLPAVNYETLKALVLVYGQTETAKLTGESLNTIKTLTRRKGWAVPNPHKRKTAPGNQPGEVKKGLKLSETLPADALASAMQKSKVITEMQLARYNANATGDLAKMKSKSERLQHTRKAKDLADVHRTIFPVEHDKPNSIINLAVLIGNRKAVKAQAQLPSSCQVIDADAR